MGSYDMLLLTTIKCIPLVAVRTVPYRAVPYRRCIAFFVFNPSRKTRKKTILFVTYSRVSVMVLIYVTFHFLDFVAALLFVIHFSDWIPTRKYSLFLLLLLFHLLFVYSIVFF